MSIIISQNGKNAKKVEKSAFNKEDHLQGYIYNNPDAIPIYDIKEGVRLLVLVREFPTNSGPIDAIGVDQDGEIYIIETKLYKNPDKRYVVAQALDYGAALWKHLSDYEDFTGILDESVRKTFNLPFGQKVQEYYGLSDDELSTFLDNFKNNLHDGILRFVILMDSLDERLKDLILYVNQNSQFDIYAVELEYYQHDSYEIIIPKIFGAEVKKDVKGKSRSNTNKWTWETFEERLKEFGDKEAQTAGQILDWCSKNDIAIDWGTSQIGSFVLCFYTSGKKGFYPFTVTGKAMVAWNTPHQGDKSPTPFDKKEKRIELLKHLSLINGASVELENVDGYNGFKLPLHAIADEDNLQEFFKVCLWIKQTLKNE